MEQNDIVILQKYDDYYCEKKIKANNFQFLHDYSHKFIKRDKESIKNALSEIINNQKNKTNKLLAYLTTSYSIQYRLIQFFNVTMNYFISLKAKQLNFVSIEFSLGRFLQNALYNLQLENVYRETLKPRFNLDDIIKEEKDQGPGCSNSGRFAACLLDSLATLNYPTWGYGLYYSKGYIKQKFNTDGTQYTEDDVCDRYLKPWCIKRDSIKYEVEFGGKIDNETWAPNVKVTAIANDFLIPGYHTINTITLRLWSSFIKNDNNECEELSRLTERIHPNDSNDERINQIRFEQEYFLASATVQDILYRLKNEQKATINDLPKYASIHINHTQPCLMTIELLRILIDKENMNFDDAFSIVNQVFTFTCHSIIPMTFEKWPVELFEKLLPRHLRLIYQVNDFILGNLSDDLRRETSLIIDEYDQDKKCTEQKVGMINLAIACSHTVNGVSEMQTKMLTEKFFKVYKDKYPDKFLNITNGISIRRWLHHCNKPLSKLITKYLDGDESWPIFNTANSSNIYQFKSEETDKGDQDSKKQSEDNISHYKFNPSVTESKWNRTSEKLSSIIEDPDFKEECLKIKIQNKRKLTMLYNFTVTPEIHIFDIFTKDIKYHTRQTLHIFSIIYHYLEIVEDGQYLEPKVYIIAGKASPQQEYLKQLVALINNVVKVINNDERTQNIIRVEFLPNYNVSMAENLVPAADVNPQITTPDMEAAATTSMKFALNGSLIIGSNGGTNLELKDEIGDENVILFGSKLDHLEGERNFSKSIRVDSNSYSKLNRVIYVINCNRFGDCRQYDKIINSLHDDDYNLIKMNFENYINTQRKLDEIASNPQEMNSRRVAAIPHMGQLSSDRAAVEYAERVWGIKQYPLPIEIIDAQEK